MVAAAQAWDLSDKTFDASKGDYWTATVKAFKDNDQTEEDAPQPASSRILQSQDWDCETKPLSSLHRDSR